MKKFIVVSALSLAASATFAASGGQLLDALESRDAHTQGSAIGYIQGVVDTQTGVDYCLTAADDFRDVKNAIHRWLKENPSMLKYNAYETITKALLPRWSCKPTAWNTVNPFVVTYTSKGQL